VSRFERDGGVALEEFVAKVNGLIGARGPEILLAAGVVVGFAIALDGAVSRAFNGVAGILWFIAAGALLLESSKRREFWELLITTLLYSFALVIAVRPSDVLWAAIGFTVAGAAVAMRSSRAPERAALLLPALWLPVHLVTAIGKAIYRNLANEPAAIRTDPPPTAAIVPLVMIVAAYVGGWLVARHRERSESSASAA
jgi:hypothetical protein